MRTEHRHPHTQRMCHRQGIGYLFVDADYKTRHTWDTCHSLHRHGCRMLACSEKRLQLDAALKRLSANRRSHCDAYHSQSSPSVVHDATLTYQRVIVVICAVPYDPGRASGNRTLRPGWGPCG